MSAGTRRVSCRLARTCTHVGRLTEKGESKGVGETTYRLLSGAPLSVDECLSRLVLADDGREGERNHPVLYSHRCIIPYTLMRAHPTFQTKMPSVARPHLLSERLRALVVFGPEQSGPLDHLFKTTLV